MFWRVPAGRRGLRVGVLVCVRVPVCIRLLVCQVSREVHAYRRTVTQERLLCRVSCSVLGRVLGRGGPPLGRCTLHALLLRGAQAAQRCLMYPALVLDHDAQQGEVQKPDEQVHTQEVKPRDSPVCR